MLYIVSFWNQTVIFYRNFKQLIYGVGKVDRFLSPYPETSLIPYQKAPIILYY